MIRVEISVTVGGHRMWETIHGERGKICWDSRLINIDHIKIEFGFDATITSEVL